MLLLFACEYYLVHSGLTKNNNKWGDFEASRFLATAVHSASETGVTGWGTAVASHNALLAASAPHNLTPPRWLK